MHEIVKQRDAMHTQLSSFQHACEQMQQENNSLKDEVEFYIRKIRFFFYSVK